MENLERLIRLVGPTPNLEIIHQDPSLYEKIVSVAKRTGELSIIPKIIGMTRVIHKTSPDDRGYTNAATRDFKKHKNSLGRFLYLFAFVKNGYNWTWFVGESGSLKLCGFGWGYGGTGPQGLASALKQLNVDSSVYSRVFRESRDKWILVP